MSRGGLRSWAKQRPNNSGLDGETSGFDRGTSGLDIGTSGVHQGPGSRRKWTLNLAASLPKPGPPNTLQENTYL